MNETQFSTKVQLLLESLRPGVFHWKTHGEKFSMPGMPDIMGVSLGHAFSIELKVFTSFNYEDDWKKSYRGSQLATGSMLLASGCNMHGFFLIPDGFLLEKWILGDRISPTSYEVRNDRLVIHSWSDVYTALRTRLGCQL